MISLAVAESDEHLEGILSLQRRCHFRAVSPEVQATEGFVFAEHTVCVLRRMAAQSPQTLALEHELPALQPMFEQFRRCDFRGRPLMQVPFIVGGQVCVDRAHRGHGLLARLYNQLREETRGQYELCLTEIATRNRVSLRAHQKRGFELISTYRDAAEEWAVVAWSLTAA